MKNAQSGCNIRFSIRQVLPCMMIKTVAIPLPLCLLGAMALVHWGQLRQEPWYWLMWASTNVTLIYTLLCSSLCTAWTAKLHRDEVMTSRRGLIGLLVSSIAFWILGAWLLASPVSDELERITARDGSRLPLPDAALIASLGLLFWSLLSACLALFRLLEKVVFNDSNGSAQRAGNQQVHNEKNDQQQPQVRR
ncbi:membrane hypothetical protein [Pseudomonas sp. 8Z]|uniref:hypothetical protein n=1 Tax=Pseudomonas sp. 8Z TaxID=2653166 RepID=UPI0012F07B31|nr:hypothetical protein [Pseudomonas sp. 8Z]VXC25075.1 membrane hypothetical protein [Pseudomonas sp. 8Z]